MFNLIAKAIFLSLIPYGLPFSAQSVSALTVLTTENHASFSFVNPLDGTEQQGTSRSAAMPRTEMPYVEVRFSNPLPEADDSKEEISIPARKPMPRK